MDAGSAKCRNCPASWPTGLPATRRSRGPRPSLCACLPTDLSTAKVFLKLPTCFSSTHKPMACDQGATGLGRSAADRLANQTSIRLTSRTCARDGLILSLLFTMERKSALECWQELRDIRAFGGKICEKLPRRAGLALTKSHRYPRNPFTPSGSLGSQCRMNAITSAAISRLSSCLRQ